MVATDFQIPIDSINQYTDFLKHTNIQELFVNKEYGYDNQLIKDIINDESLSKRDKIVRLCYLTKDKIPYAWGNKIIDENGNMIDPILNKENGIYIYDGLKLDCSGYTQYIYWLVDESIGVGTGEQSENGKKVSKPEIGDLGIIFQGNSNYYDKNGNVCSKDTENATFRTNHVGIYLGNGLWAHCNGAENNVSINSPGYFHIYRSYL